MVADNANTFVPAGMAVWSPSDHSVCDVLALSGWKLAESSPLHVGRYKDARVAKKQVSAQKFEAIITSAATDNPRSSSVVGAVVKYPQCCHDELCEEPPSHAKLLEFRGRIHALSIDNSQMTCGIPMGKRMHCLRRSHALVRLMAFSRFCETVVFLFLYMGPYHS